ncbi:hypothetical protein RPD_1606 [Rhodopseudomonas palustris BisB5]|uniref:Uncharacterized protein n=1 Tax=Rhodopseudomonas palustris (strain BisB5) TaxID=316057 RepID=Q13AP6_RHOPS|nr:hypothetical protein RPD_1606 [Rhodopseudomonas palustris BisB5]
MNAARSEVAKIGDLHWPNWIRDPSVAVGWIGLRNPSQHPRPNAARKTHRTGKNADPTRSGRVALVRAVGQGGIQRPAGSACASATW